MVDVTEHAKKRIKNRMGFSKNLSDEIADKALQFGIKHNEVSGNLKKFLDGLYLSHKIANNMRIYNQKVFLFKGNKLITIVNLPANLCKTAEKIKANIQR